MRELKEDYSFDDLACAHAVLDEFDRLVSEAGDR